MAANFRVKESRRVGPGGASGKHKSTKALHYFSNAEEVSLLFNGVKLIIKEEEKDKMKEEMMVGIKLPKGITKEEKATKAPAAKKKKTTTTNNNKTKNNKKKDDTQQQQIKKKSERGAAGKKEEENDEERRKRREEKKKKAEEKK